MNTDPVPFDSIPPREVTRQTTECAGRWLRSILMSAFDVNATTLSIKLTHGIPVLVATAINGDGHEMPLGMAQRRDIRSLEQVLQELIGNKTSLHRGQNQHLGQFKDPSDPRNMDTAEVYLENDRTSCSFVFKFQRNYNNH
jgi:hypothetical protein